MNPHPKIHWYLAVAVIYSGLCSGCHDEPDQTVAAKPFAGEIVRVAVPEGLGLDQFWQTTLDEWTERTGGRYQVATYKAAAGARSVAEMLSGERQSPPGQTPTLIMIPLSAIAELAARGMLAEIPENLRSEPGGVDWFDIFQGLRENVLSSGGKPTVIPLSCPVLTCYYRRDLLDDAGLSPPQTWQEYQKLLETMETWAPRMTAVEPWSEEFRATMYLARALPYAKHPGNYSLFFDIRSTEPLIASPGFVRALREARSDLQRMPAEVAKYSPADCRRELLHGRAAMAIALEWPEAPADEFARPESPMVIGFSRLPGSPLVYHHAQNEWGPPPGASFNYVTLAGFAGWGLAVSARAAPARQQAAWNLLTTLTSAENVSLAFPGGVKSLCRQSQRDDALAWGSFDLNASEISERIEVVADSLQNPRLVAELPVIARGEFRTALTRGLSSVIAGEKEPAEALQAVAKEWLAIAHRVGVDKLSDSYRLSLGLPPAIRRPAELP